MGIEQGLVESVGSKDFLKGFLPCQGRYDARYRDSGGEQYLFVTSREDRSGGLAHSFLGGLRIDTRTKDRVSGLRSGLWVKASFA